MLDPRDIPRDRLEPPHDEDPTSVARGGHRTRFLHGSGRGFVGVLARCHQRARSVEPRPCPDDTPCA